MSGVWICMAALLGAPSSTPPPRVDPGWTQLLAGNDDQAAESFDAALQRDPGDLSAALGWAQLKEARRDLPGAIETLVRALSINRDGALRFGLVAQLIAWLPRAEDGGALATELLTELAADDPDLELRSAAIEALAEVHRRLGGADQSIRSIVEAQGRVTDWRLLGPFGRLESLAMQETFSPETESDDRPSDRPGPSGFVARRVEMKFADGRGTVPLQFHQLGVVYAATTLHRDGPGTFQLRVQTPTSYRLFVDGKELLSADRITERPALAQSTTLSLSAGEHRLLLKLGNSGRFPWFIVGVTPARAEARRAGSAPNSPSLEDPAAAIAASLWLRARGLDREAGGILAAASERWPSAPLIDYLYGLHVRDAQTGSAVEKDFERSRALLEKAVAGDPHFSTVKLLIGEMDDAGGRLDDAWTAVTNLLDSDPSDVDALRLAARIAMRRSWSIEARDLIERARARAPRRLDLLDAAIDIYRGIGAATALREALRERAQSDPLDNDWPEALSLGGDLAAALAAWDRVLAVQPADAYAGLSRARLLFDVGRESEALQALDRLAQIYPDDGLIQSRRAMVLSALGREAEATSALQASLSNAPDQVDLREALYRRGNPDLLAPYLADATQVVASAPAPDADVDSALLADISVNEIDRYGGQTELYQGIHKVYTRDGVEHEGQLDVLPGAHIEQLRIHKSDGHIVDVESDHRPLHLPSLEPGDAIEYVWRRYAPPLGILPGALDNGTVFLFQGPDRAYALSRYTILQDPQLPLAVCGNTAGLEVDDRVVGSTRIRDYVARRMPLQRLEPHVADRIEVTPYVRLGYGLAWGDIGDLIRSSASSLLYPDAPLPELAAEVKQRAQGKGTLALARALHAVVSEKLKPGHQTLSLGTPASVSASSGEGNRTLIALALARQLGLDARLVFGRSADRRGRELECPNPEFFNYVLLELSIDKQRLFLDYSDGNHEFDSFPPALNGADALEVPIAGGQEPRLIDLPQREVGYLREQRAELTLGENGEVSGRLTLTLKGIYGSYLRRMIGELPADRLDQLLRSIVGEAFPGASPTTHQIDGLDRNEGALVISIGLTGGSFGRATTSGLQLPISSEPVPILSEFGSFPVRRLPMLLDLELYRHDLVTVTLPAGARLDAIPNAVHLEGPFGSFDLEARDEAGKLVIERRGVIPRRRIEPQEYESFRDFAQAIDEAERREVGVIR